MLLALSSVAIAAPHGKVVRVERHADGPIAEPRLCQFQSRDVTGVCLGLVKAGDVAVILSNDAVVGEVRIDESHATKDGCEVLENVKGTLISGAVTQMNLGIVSGGIDRTRGRLMPDTANIASPNGRDQVRVAVDRDGDGVADIVMTQSQCDANSSPGSCFDMWASGSGRVMHQVLHVNLQSCY
jgi:hypothetical protein